MWFFALVSKLDCTFCGAKIQTLAEDDRSFMAYLCVLSGGGGFLSCVFDVAHKFVKSLLA